MSNSGAENSLADGDFRILYICINLLYKIEFLISLFWKRNGDGHDYINIALMNEDKGIRKTTEWKPLKT